MTWLYRITLEDGIDPINTHLAYADTPKKAMELLNDLIKDYEEKYTFKSTKRKWQLIPSKSMIKIIFGSVVSFSSIEAMSDELYTNMVKFITSGDDECEKD